MNEQQEELLRLVEHVRGWVKDNLEKKSPDRAMHIRFLLANLNRIAHHKPDQAGAALLGAKTIWHMLFEDAWTGYGVRHGRKDLPATAPVDDVVRLWAELYEQEPDIKKSKAVKKIAEELECSERTVWNRLQQVGI